MDQKEFLNKVKHAVLSVDDKAKVILFGSRARGDAKKDSDWDFLILTQKKTGRVFHDSIRDTVYDIELEYLQPISMVIYDVNDWNKIAITGFYENVMREGVAL